MIANLVNVLQVGLTVTFLLACWLLLSTWRRSFLETAQVEREQWSPEQWLTVGIFVGFAGNLLDNGFWGIHWLMDLYEHPQTPLVLNLGPVANLFFRQVPGIIAVYCHLRAAVGLTRAGYSLTRKIMIYSIAGVATVFALSFSLFA